MDYRRLCAALIAEVRRLRAENEELLDDLGHYQDEARAARQQARDEAHKRAEEGRRREQEEYMRWEAREKALREAERCYARGDDYGYERAMRRLREW